MHIAPCAWSNVRFATNVSLLRCIRGGVWPRQELIRGEYEFSTTLLVMDGKIKAIPEPLALGDLTCAVSVGDIYTLYMYIVL